MTMNKAQLSQVRSTDSAPTDRASTDSRWRGRTRRAGPRPPSRQRASRPGRERKGRGWRREAGRGSARHPRSAQVSSPRARVARRALGLCRAGRALVTRRGRGGGGGSGGKRGTAKVGMATPVTSKQEPRGTRRLAPACNRLSDCPDSGNGSTVALTIHWQETHVRTKTCYKNKII